MPRLSQYDFIFAIGTGFAMLDAYNNGANDVANSWATSVSSRSISYRMAMVLGAIFEMLGAITVGSRTADTIKNGIIPPSAFREDAGVQMLAFTCALAAASSWVMWCTRHSAHVSSTYSLVSAVAGVGVAVAGAAEVQWGWNGGKGMGAIFAGLVMAPVIAGGFGSVIFSLIKFVVHVRKNPVKWAVYTSPFWFLVAGTSCVLTIVYKGSPNLKLNNREGWWQAAIILGTGGAVCLLSALFFLPYVHAKVIKRDPSIKWYHAIYGPMLFYRPSVDESDKITVPDYAVVQHDEKTRRIEPAQVTETKGQWVDTPNGSDSAHDMAMEPIEAPVPPSMRPEPQSYDEILAANQERFHDKLRQSRGPLGWAMRTLHDNPIDQGAIHELHNLKALARRLPAMVVVGLMYGSHYDIHAAQTGIAGTPEGNRMEAVYSHAKKYSNEVEHTYSFVQVLTACTASFAHGANDVGNAVGPWAAIYSAWSTGDAQGTKAPVPIWQLAVMSGMISIGLITYGFNIMKVMGNKITYHSPSRGCSMEMGAALTIVIFSQYSLPVSTSMCITGATVGVGLCNGTLRAVNWHRVGLLMISWLATIPIAGTLAGVITGLFLNSPRFGLSG